MILNSSIVTSNHSASKRMSILLWLKGHSTILHIKLKFTRHGEYYSAYERSCIMSSVALEELAKSEPRRAEFERLYQAGSVLQETLSSWIMGNPVFVELDLCSRLKVICLWFSFSFVSCKSPTLWKCNIKLLEYPSRVWLNSEKITSTEIRREPCSRVSKSIHNVRPSNPWPWPPHP